MTTINRQPSTINKINTTFFFSQIDHDEHEHEEEITKTPQDKQVCFVQQFISLSQSLSISLMLNPFPIVR